MEKLHKSVTYDKFCVSSNQGQRANASLYSTFLPPNDSNRGADNANNIKPNVSVKQVSYSITEHCTLDRQEFEVQLQKFWYPWKQNAPNCI